MELVIPGWMVLAAAAVGGAVGAFFALALIWRMYTDTDSARHSYMAREIAGLRRRHNDYTDVQMEDPFPPLRPIPRLVHYLLDKLYSRGRPMDPYEKDGQ